MKQYTKQRKCIGNRLQIKFFQKKSFLSAQNCWLRISTPCFLQNWTFAKISSDAGLQAGRLGQMTRRGPFWPWPMIFYDSKFRWLNPGIASPRTFLTMTTDWIHKLDALKCCVKMKKLRVTYHKTNTPPSCNTSVTCPCKALVGF